MAEAKRILIIGGKEKVLVKAKRLGLEVLYIQKKSLFRVSDLDHVDLAIVTDFEDLAVLLPLARALNEVLPFRRALSLTEPGLIPAARINDALGLADNSLKSVLLLKDKWAMRQHLNALGVSPVAARIGKNNYDMHSFLREYGVPMIVKPVDASGSLGIFAVQEPSDVESTWERVQQLGLSYFLMEEYLEGPEISVEAFTFSGQHVVLAMTDKQTLPNFIESGHSVPAQLDKTSWVKVEAAVRMFLDAVGYRDGPSHTEVKLSPQGPRIIESHNRIGGDKINELVEIAYGVDMDRLALAWPFGLVEPLDRTPTARAGAAVRFFTPPSGVVREVVGIDQVRDCEGVVELYLPLQVGKRVPPLRYSLDRSGHLLTKGPDVQTAIERCDRLVSQIRIVTAETMCGDRLLVLPTKD